MKQTTHFKDAEDYIDEVFEPLRVMGTKEKCELCNLVKKTKWYFENDKWIICECAVCHRPMIVYKEHTMFIPITEWFAIFNQVINMYGSEVTLRFKQRKIKNHFHVHIYKTSKI